MLNLVIKFQKKINKKVIFPHIRCFFILLGYIKIKKILSFRKNDHIPHSALFGDHFIFLTLCKIFFVEYFYVEQPNFFFLPLSISLSLRLVLFFFYISNSIRSFLLLSVKVMKKNCCCFLFLFFFIFS